MGLRTIPRVPAPRISLCMIMRDEQEHLARCLTSVQGAVDEVVIVDTGSVDDSVAIAEGFGARVLHERWRGDFAAPRNTAIDAASGDWILVLDADEELVGASALGELVQADGVEGWSLREVNFIGEERGIDSVVMSAFRLFRNRPEYRYEGALHEQVMGAVAAAGHGEMRFAGVEIHHYGYLEPTNRAKRKSERNMAIVLDEVKRRPDDPFTLFNAGVEFQRVERHDEALGYFRRSFGHLDSLGVYYASLLVRNIVASLHLLGRNDEALEVLADALQAYPDFADLHHMEGRVHAARREYRAAMRSFRRAVEIGEHGGDRYLSQAGMGSFYALSGLGLLHQLMGEKADAVRHFKRSIEAADGFFPAPVSALTRLLLDTDPPDVVRQYMSNLVSERKRGDALILVAEALLERGHAEEARIALAAARAAGADEARLLLQEAEASLRLNELDRARNELRAIAEESASHQRACAALAVVELLAGRFDAACAALEPIESDSASGAAVRAAYGRAIAVHAGEEGEPLTPDPAVREVLFSLAGSLLALDRLDSFNLVTPLLYEAAAEATEIDERLGLLLLGEGFREPATERLLAAVEADVASPDALAALGRICQSRELDEDAVTFFETARDRDRQNISRYLDLAQLHAGQGRFGAADEALRDGLVMHPYSSVLGELRQSMRLLSAV